MKLKKLYSFLTLLTAFLWLGFGTAWGDELTVANGTETKEAVPVYGWNGDTKDTKSQTLYLSSDLTSMAGKDITALKFYSSTANVSWGSAVFDVKLAHVTAADMSSSPLSPSFTTVYSGAISVVSNEMSIAFDEPFTYNGTDNLLLEIHISTKGDYAHAYFYGVTTEEYMGVMSYPGWSGTQTTKVWFTPKTTFTYAAATSSCAKPTELGYSNVTATSVDLDWTNGGTESSWNVLYKASSDADWSTTVASKHPFTLSGLTPNTNYQVKVQAVCGENDESGFSNVVSFPTPCADLVAPFEAITFAGLSNNTNVECWDNTASTCFSNPAGTTQKYYVWGVFKYSGNEMLRMNNFNTRAGSALINTPNIIIPNDGKEYELVFDYIHSSSQGDPFYVKVSENGGASFSDLKSFAKNSSTSYDAAVGFTEGSVSLAGYNNKTIILQFYATADYGNGAIFLDNVRIKASSSCVKPTALSYSNLTASSVDLSWTAGASETAWNVRYMADGDADWTVIPADDNDGFTVSGLSDNTHYTMQVQADCGSEVVSEWNSTAIDFTTKCNAFTMPFEQTFNDLTVGIPDCWDNSEGTTDNDAYKWNYYATGYSGKCVRFEALYNATGNDNYLKTPSITISAAARLSFRYKNPKGAALSVYYAIDGGSKTVLQSSFDTKTSWSDKVEIDLPADCVDHDVEIFFKGVSNCSYGDAYIYLDEVSVKAQPTCFAPTGLGYSAVTAEGATLSWTVGKEGDNAWVVEYSKNPDFSSSSSVAATTNPFTLTGLDEQTTYYVRVKTDCGSSEYSEESGAVNFPTKCAAIVLNSLNPSWEENFDDETNETVVACWDNSASSCFTNPAGSTPSKYVWGVIRTGSYGDYNYQLYMRNFNVRAGTALINTPSFTLPSDKDMQLVFNYSHLASCDPLVVKISQNGGAFAAIDGASYSNDPAGSYSYSSPGTYKEATIDLSAYRGKTITLQFFTTANYGEGAIWLDNVRIEAAPTCFKPQNLSAASSITPDGATFAWTASGHGETTYQWAVAAGSDAPAWVDDAAHKTSELTKTVTGLAAGTYKFYVRSYCDSEDQSDAAVSASFTTATVTAPTIGTITTTNESAHATWTAPDVTYSVQYQWSLDGSSWSAATSNLYADISDLEDNTSYTFYVRSYYDATRQSAAVSKAFKTACDPFTVAVGTPFEQNFNDVTTNAIPDCWNNNEGTTTTASYKWKVVTGGQSGKCAMFNGTDNGSGKTNVFATPLITINSDADLSFYWKNKKTGAYTVEISVNGATRTTLADELISNDAWTLVDMPLTSYYDAETPKTIQLFFCGTSINDGSANLYLDEFKITPISCRKPASDPVVSSKDDTHATITWTAGGDNTDYQFCLAPAGTAEGDLVWDENNVVTALTTSFDDLTPLTNYDFYVRTYCDSENQSDARKVSFKTECADYVTLPFNENFDALAYQTIPECWNNDEGTSGDYYKWKAVMPISSTNYVQFNSSTNDADATNVLATPTILLGEGNLLTFKCMNPTGGDFKVQIEGEGIAREDLLTGLTGIADWTLKYVAIPAKFNNKKVQLFFCATSNAGDGNAYISLDDVRVTRGEVFSDAEDNASRFTALKAAGETMDVIFNRTLLFNGDYNTLCLPFSLNEEQLADAECPLNNFKLKVYDYSAVVNDELQIAIAGASSIEAGVPYFAAYQGNVANKSLHLFKDVVISADAAGEKADGQVTYQGVLNKGVLADQTANAENPEILYLGAGNKIYWPAVEGGLTIKGFRAYFSINYSSTPSGAPVRPRMSARIVERAEVPTGCENINAEGKAVKLLENNQVVIIRNGVKYTIQGQKIQ